jgi:hypothetical protein
VASRLADALGITLDYLLGKFDNKEPSKPSVRIYFKGSLFDDFLPIKKSKVIFMQTKVLFTPFRALSGESQRLDKPNKGNRQNPLDQAIRKWDSSGYYHGILRPKKLRLNNTFCAN